jgi:hypothetical protein
VGSDSVSLFADQNGHIRGIKRVGVHGGFARQGRGRNGGGSGDRLNEWLRRERG